MPRLDGDGIVVERPGEVDYLADHLFLHDGTTGPSHPDYRDFSYAPEAMVPQPASRRLSVQEIGRVASTKRGEGAICLIRLPEDWLAAFRRTFASLELCTSEAEFPQYLGGNGFSRLAAQLRAEAAEWAGSISPFLARISRPGLPTATDDAGRLIGLHVDRWHQTIPNGGERPSRMCMNVGTETRSFFFVNRRLSRFAEHREAAAGCPLEGSFLARSFLREHPRHPVLRLDLPVGCGYIAPTEDIIHDASTAEMAAWDVVVYGHGYFDVTKVPQSWRI